MIVFHDQQRGVDEGAGLAVRELTADESGELIAVLGSPDDHRRRVSRPAVGQPRA
jgi:hypothetical protein